MKAVVSRRGFVRRAGAAAAAAAAAGRGDFALLARGVAGPEASHAAPIRLDETRNPYGPAPAVLQTLRDGVAAASVYGHADTVRLREAIAAVHHVTPAQVVLGCGSSDLLRGAARAFTGPDRPLIAAVPTCEVMARGAADAGAAVVAVPLRPDFSHDLEAMRAWSTAAPGLVYVCNPNSPTGTLAPRRDVDRLLDTVPPQVYVLVDEACCHYVDPSPDYASAIDGIAGNPRVIVTRTFSKVYGLAGLRVG